MQAGNSLCRRLFHWRFLCLSIHTEKLPARSRRRVSSPAAAQLTGRPPLTGGFFMRPAVGVRGSFAVRGSWIAGIVFYLLFSPARFKSGRPHHLAGTPYRFHKAHDGFLHDFSPSPGVAGVPLRARPGRRPRKAVTGLCALFFVSRVLPGGIGPAGHGRPDAFLRKKFNKIRPSLQLTLQNEMTA